MIYQNLIWTIALVGMGLIALGFIYIVANAGRPADADAAQKAQHRIATSRRWLFVLLLVLFFGVSYASLHRFPIPKQHSPLTASQVVDVVGRQWSWQLTREGQEPGSALQLVTGSPVEFRVTSVDVNHGFAIYAPDGRIAIQTQAMPGFTNKLLYTFRQPGSYKVMCLEYCGLGHAPMVAGFEVIAPAGG